MKYKLCLIIISILLAVWICGCSIPLRITTYTSPQELSKQEELRQEEIARDKYQRMIKRHARRLAKKVAKKKKLQEEAMQESNQILNTFDKEGRIIIIAFEKNGVPILQIAQELKDYGKSDFEGFVEYYFKRDYPFSDRETIIKMYGEDYLDEKWIKIKNSGKIADVRKTYNLLLEINK